MHISAPSNASAERSCLLLHYTFQAYLLSSLINSLTPVLNNPVTKGFNKIKYSRYRFLYATLVTLILKVNGSNGRTITT